MNLRDRILSDNNIYAAIHALPNTLRERNLICGNRQQYKNDLTEIYKYGASHDEFLFRCKRKLSEALDSVFCEFFTVSIFFKFKDVEDEVAKYRPIHNCDIETHVCLLALLQALCYEDDYDNGSRALSGLSNLIPKNFWGNQLSITGHEIYKPWAPAYTSYVQKSIKKAKLYKSNRLYSKEINLDFRDFFPSINIGWLSQTIKNKLCAKYVSDDDRETLKRVLELLLYFEIDSSCTYNDDELSIYYGRPTKFKEGTIYYTKGLPQGLPHTYFFANIVMAEIESCISEEFKGDADFYVDDAVIFCNCEKSAFKSKIDYINAQFSLSDINNHEYSEIRFINEFQKKHFDTGLLLHRNHKSSIIDLSEDESFASDNLAMLYRNASGVSVEIRTSLSDLNDKITLDETQAILNAIKKELERLNRIKNDSEKDECILESINLYEKRIKSYYKYYTFRESLILKKKNCTSDSLLNDFKNKYARVEPDTNIDSNLDYLVFQNLYRLLLSEFYDKRNDIIRIVSNVDKAWSNLDQTILIQPDHLYYTIDAEHSAPISDIVCKCDYSEFEVAINQSPKNDTKSLKRLDCESDGVKTIISLEHCFTDRDIRYFISCIDPNFRRNSILFKLKSYLDIPIDCGYNYYRKSNRPLLWYQLRLLHYLSLSNFDYSDFKAFSSKIVEQLKGGSECYPVDYLIFHVLPLFATYVKDHIKNDLLIQAHHYIYDIWKNGSKFLHFYTLHNAEHSIVLIRKSIELITACGYFKLTHTECFLLFLSCYLHDISMTTYPDISTFNEDKVKDAKHALYNQNKVIRHYYLVDNYFEKKIRDGHQQESATIIRKGQLGFELDEFVRNAVAVISESHGAAKSKVYSHCDTPEALSYQKLSIMLRIVDTLDMCEERVSPFYFSLTESQIPELSKFHWLSHLGVKSCELETKYTLVDNFDDDTIDDTYLDFKHIREQIRLIIKLNTRQDTSISLPNTPCGNVSVTSTNDEVKVKICEGKCEMECCPLVCRWMKEKNPYLLSELYELQQLLECKKEYYNTSFIVEYKFAATEQMGKYIPFISRHLINSKSSK